MAEKRINSRAKGSEYERKIAKVLGRWWGEEFHRTPASGGLHWKADNRVAGDIVTPPNSNYPFVTECKKREGWLLEQLIKGTGDLETYWKQVSNDSERTGLKPLLIFAKNFSPDYVMFRHDDLLAIVATYMHNERKFPHINSFVVNVGRESRVIMLLDEFLQAISKEDIVEAFKL